MDNRKLYKRLSTFFWFSFATFPFWICLIGACFTFIGLQGTNFEGVSYENSFAICFDSTFQSLFLDLDWVSCVPSFVYSLFYTLIEAVVGPDYYIFMPIFISWFVWAFMLELLVDIFIWLPNIIHKGIEKWGA